MNFRDFDSLTIKEQAKYLIKKRKENQIAQSFAVSDELDYEIMQRYQPASIYDKDVFMVKINKSSDYDEIIKSLESLKLILDECGRYTLEVKLLEIE